MKIAVITGASSGIGQEFAYQIDKCLGAQLDEIWLIARRKERLEEMSKLLKTKARIIPMDVTKQEDIEQYKKLLSIGKPEVCISVLAAGFGYQGAFNKLPLECQTDMIDCNITALTKMAYETIPYMKRNGRMILLASAAAFMPQANFAIYAATKSYVLSFGRALNAELYPKGITVTSVCPGPVDTDFFDISEKFEKGKDFKKLTMVSPQLVVRQALADSMDKRDICIPGAAMKAFYPVTKFISHRFLLKLLRFIK